MASLDRFRALVDDDEPARNRRYPDVEDAEDLATISDPHVTADETARSWRDWIEDNRWWALLVALLGLLGVAVLAIYFGRYFITTLTHPWVKTALGAAGIFGAGVVIGSAMKGSQLLGNDWAIFYDPEARRPLVYAGEYTREDSPPVFKAYKGIGGLVGSASPYQIRDVSPQLVTKFNRDPEAPVTIRLHPEAAMTAQTFIGTVSVQVTAGVEPDPFGTYSNHVATLPDQAVSGTVTEMKEQMVDMRDEIETLRNRLERKNRQYQTLLEEYEKSREEIRAEIRRDVEIVEPFARRQGTGDSSNGHRSDREMQFIADELGGGDS